MDPRSALVVVVVDLGFGDAGKGTITDFLVRDRSARAVVRFNGGAQAGHTVVTHDGRSHTFSQIGAGAFVPGTRTHLAEPFVLDPGALLLEAQRLESLGVAAPLDVLTIDARARVITPFHLAANHLREAARGAAHHGTCGVGFGETVADALVAGEDAVRASDLGDRGRLRKKAKWAQERLRASLASACPSPWQRVLDDDGALLDRWVEQAGPAARCVSDEGFGAILASGPVIFEGAQGILLDETFGFHPHTTWSDCTPRGALALLAEHGITREAVAILGVSRSYATRHGAGPFPSEDVSMQRGRPEPHNTNDGAQGAFRVGALDHVLLRYAVSVAGPLDGLAITHLDRPLTPPVVAYEDARDPNLFVHDAMHAIGLRSGDLEHQTRLGEALSAARPRYGELRAPELRAADWRAAIQEALSLPIVLTSSGPTASEKAWRNAD